MPWTPVTNRRRPPLPYVKAHGYPRCRIPVCLRTHPSRSLPCPAEVRDRVRVVRSRSPTEFIPVADFDLESAERQVPSSIAVSTQAPGQVGALAHPPPLTRVVGLPESSFAQHHKSTSLFTRCARLSWGGSTFLRAPFGSVGSSKSTGQDYPYQLLHTSVYASDYFPNHRIPDTRSVASDCGGREREVTGGHSHNQAPYWPHSRAHSHLQARQYPGCKG